MSRSLRCILPLLCLVASSAISFAENSPRLSFITKPLSFEPNVGQSASSAQFLSQSQGYSVELAPSQVAFKIDTDRSIQMDLVGADHNASLKGERLLSGKTNYFPSPDSKQWHTDIPTYERVSATNVYPGVDLAFYSNQGRFEYDFVLQPGVSADQVRIQLSGSAKAHIDQNGDLIFTSKHKELSLLKPVIYQLMKDGKSREAIQGDYRLDAESGILSFAIGAYDHTRLLVIDPVLQYSEYLSNQANAVAVDTAGNTYIVSGSQNVQSSIVKLSPSGAIIYSTSFGLGLTPSSVAVDSSGRAYIAGTAGFNSTLPVQPNAYSSAEPLESAAFFLQVAANGSSIPYATYLGGSTDFSTNQANGIAVDVAGNAYLAGYTSSNNFPTTAGAYETTNPPTFTSGFVAKFNPSLPGKSSLVYSTLIGLPASAVSSSTTSLNGIAVDSLGEAYVTASGPSGYPVTNGSFQYSGLFAGSGGVFVTKFNSSGSALLYSAYLGYGLAHGIAVDAQQYAYITGTVYFADFPVTTGAYQTTFAGGFVTKLNPAGSAETFSTFLGGPSGGIDPVNISPTSLAITPGCPATSPAVVYCNVYVSGETNKTDFPLVNAIQSTPAALYSSVFVVELSNTGQSALLSTYLGGTSEISLLFPPAMAVDPAGNIHLIGNLASEGRDTNFPVTVPAPPGEYPAFLATISSATAGELVTSLPSLLPGLVGIPSTAGTLKLQNLGSSAAAIASIHVSPSAFSQTNNCGSSIPAGSACTLTVNFTAPAAGNTSGTLTIASNAQNNPFTIALTGVGQYMGYLTSPVASITFPTQTVGIASAAKSLVVTNTGNVAATPLISNYLGDFAVTNNCPGQLAVQASCTVSVTFDPQQAGLRSDSIAIQDSISGRSFLVPISGTGTLATLTAAITVSPSSLEFAPLGVGSGGSSQQYVYITNTSAEPITVQSVITAGDFQLGDYSYLPAIVYPGTSYKFSVLFTPTAVGVRTGTVTIADSVSTTPQVLPLTGTGLASAEKLEIYPSTSVLMPDQAVGSPGPDQTIILQNTGSSPVNIYRVFTSGDFRVSIDSCSERQVPGTSDDGSGTYSTCQVAIEFLPSVTGQRTGTLTFLDSAPGSPHVVNLSGSGIGATGTLRLSDNNLTFPAWEIGNLNYAGVAGTFQNVYLQNPGDSPIQVTSVTVSGDFVQYPGSCGTPPFTLKPGNLSCNISVNFVPTASGNRTGTLTINSSAGPQVARLTGIGIPSSPAVVQFIPANSMNFGSVVVGQTGGYQSVDLFISAETAVTSSGYSLSGPNATDFSLSGTCAPPSLCSDVVIQFKPSGSGARNATLTLTDSAGTQVLSLTGTGVTTPPAAGVDPHYLNFGSQMQGLTSAGSSVTYTNNSSASVVLGNVVITGAFILLHGGDNCSGRTIPAGQACYFQVEYAPPVVTPAANSYNYGSLTIQSSTGTSLVTIPMAGYSLVPVLSAWVSQNVVHFPQSMALGATSSAIEVDLYDAGATPLIVGTIGGTNLGLAGSATEFSILPANGGNDYCSNHTISPGTYCAVLVTFTSNAVGAATGTMNFPVTYSNNTTASIAVTLNASGAAVIRQAVLSPSSLSFPDTGVGTTTAIPNSATVLLTNNGNDPLTVGALTGINTIVGTSASGEFSTKSVFGSADACSNASVLPGASCEINVTFTPTAVGTRTGSVTFPIRYLDGHTDNVTLMLNGIGLAAVKQLQIYPLSLAFRPAVPNNPGTVVDQYLTITNTGDAPVAIGNSLISTNSTDFQIDSDGCSSTVVAAGANCSISVRFNPSATSIGTRTGVLTIADNSTGGPHKIPLSGLAIGSLQQAELSQNLLNFGSQNDGGVSITQVVYLVLQGPLSETVSSVVLGGANAADFQMQSDCYLYVYGSCNISVNFAPKTGAVGTRTATVTVTDALPGSPRVVSLTGTAINP